MTPDEADTAQSGNAGVAPVQAAADLADSIFDFDPTIDPTKTVAENAAAIRDNIVKNLGGGADAGPTCGSVTLTPPGTLSIKFGPPPGCVLLKGLKVSGSAEVVVTRPSGVTTVTITLTALAVNSVDLDGTVTFAATTGSSFVTSGNMTSGGKTLKWSDITVSGSPGTITVAGTASLSGTAIGTTTVIFKQVAWKLGDCYPNSGALTVKKGLITTTITFLPTTPATGQVTVTVGRKNKTQSLPPYGTCGVKDGG